MQAFRQLKIGTQLTLSFGALVALMLVLATFAMLRMGSISAAFQHENQVNRDKLAPLYVAREALAQTGLAARNAYIFSDEAEARKELEILDQQRALYLNALDQLAPAFAGNAAFDQVRRDMLAMAEELKRPRQFREAGQMEAFGRFLVTECSPLRRKIVADIATLLAAVQQETAAAGVAAEASAVAARRWILLQAGFTLLVCVAIAALNTRWLLQQLGGEPRYASEIANRIAQGDLAVQVELGPDDRSSLLYAIKCMRDSLSGIVGKVRHDADSMAASSADISSGSHDLSGRTEQQAGALLRVAGAMRELTATVRQNAGNAQQANQLAQSASEVSLQGGQVVQQVVVTMESINASARKMSDIIAVIDGIAFQTNILALNAAVEAARAGEQGRGFAVVASEVRNLAQRSAAAAREVKALIDDSVARVDSGAALVQQAGSTMRAVVDSVQRVTEIMGDISDASQEQSAGIEQVNQAIDEMDNMTQQNLTLVSHAAAAAHALQQQAGGLTQVVGVFTLDAGRGVGATQRGLAHSGSPLKIV
ncbi:MAG: methyl-accepting chemotaxis protein [Sphingomonadaceae bacterium]